MSKRIKSQKLYTRSRSRSTSRKTKADTKNEYDQQSEPDERTDVSVPADKHAPTPCDLVAFVPWKCLQLEEPLEVVVFKEVTDVLYSTTNANSSSHRDTSKSKAKSMMSDQVESKTSEATFEKYPNALKIIAIYNCSDQLIEIKFHKNTKAVPASVIIIISTTLNFHHECFKITLRRGLSPAVVHEIANLLSVSHITDLCLDDTSLSGNSSRYEDLLTRDSSLRYLSLARCSINDVVIKRIASRLEFGMPASNSLRLLNLTGNKITDEGAKDIAKALRTNRKLIYLNLAGNWITDEGIDSIMSALKEFPLNVDEVKHKSKGLDVVRDKIIRKEIDKLDDRQETVKSRQNSTKSAKYKKSRTAEICDKPMEDDIVTPFDKKDIIIRDGYLYSMGNNTLCILNVAYNRISYLALKGILSVLMYQKVSKRQPRGILSLNIEGNNLPDECNELEDIDDLLDESIPKVEIRKKKNNTFLPLKSRNRVPE